MLKTLLMQEDVVATLRGLDKSGKLRTVEPTLAELRMSIPKGYHHKDNLTHSLQVLENAIAFEENGPDLILRAAALFHDIGKPATRKFGVKGSVTFDGHETVGAFIVRKVLKKHGFTREEIAEIAVLVAFHMRSHGFTSEKWTDSAVRRLMAEVSSEETMTRLVAIFYSDVTTRFEDKKKSLHASVDGLVEAMKLVRAKDARDSLRPAIDGHFVMETFDIKRGPELGRIMKFLNSDEGIFLSKDDAVAEIRKRFIK